MSNVRGLQNVLRNLNSAIGEIDGGTKKGLIKVGVLIKGEAVNMTPVDHGVLRQSAFRQTETRASGHKLRVGFTAEYAAWVHEMPGTLRGQPRAHFGQTGNQSSEGPIQPRAFGGGSGTGNYWDGGEPKFLEKAVKNNYSQILEIIRREASV